MPRTHAGYLGSFASYTVGNVMAAQLMEAAHQQLGATLRDALAEGDCAPLKEWLREHIWQHGRRYTRDELLIKARARI